MAGKHEKVLERWPTSLKREKKMKTFLRGHYSPTSVGKFTERGQCSVASAGQRGEPLAASRTH